MIQIMGPNDNDYIYINFKDFQYDQKWEFPRENLQLGQQTACLSLIRGYIINPRREIWTSQQKVETSQDRSRHEIDTLNQSK